MKVSYEVGPRSVTIAATGQQVKRGEVVEVPDSIGEQLVAQGWASHAPKGKPRGKAGQSQEEQDEATGAQPEEPQSPNDKE